MTWELSVEQIDEHSCELTNVVRTSFTPELTAFLARQGLPAELYRRAQQPVLEAHNRQETPLFARSIERHASQRREPVTA